ncbi:MAG TPA: endonuclease/exonuclease/phosphatase family protein [Woeseiaceae bacterium]|nr:endonuclease/exonuclease/phosphatase family protein [Woeseiaceae bacterium]
MSIGGPDWKAVGLGLLEAALLITAAFSFATLFDEWSRWLELFVHFRLQYLVISVLLTFAFLLLRWRGYIFLGIASVGLNAYFVVPWYLPYEQPAAGDTSIRLLHANVFLRNTNPERLVAEVQAFEPDILVMQEVTPGWLQGLGALDKSYPYKVVKAHDSAYGIALYSKHPFESSAIVDSAPLGIPEIIATVTIKGKPLHIVTGHPMHPIGATNFASRNSQLDELAGIAGRTPHPLIVVGDLNVTMWSHYYRSLEAKSGLRNARRGFGIKPSWPIFLPFARIPIDHCLVSADIAVTDFEIGSNIGSDHLPVLVTMSY